jgi:DNA processing protein
MQPLEDAVIRDAIESTLLPGIGIAMQGRIWKSFPEISGLFASDTGLLAELGIPDEAHPLIKGRSYRATASEILDWGRREGCTFLVRGHAGYPALLEEIFDPPLVLYAKGNLETLDRASIAIVGTRRPTIYGLHVAQGIASDLGSRGLCVVSGLARGIDAAAHRGCLESGASTLAVLGCGIDVVYPREHRQLTKKILEKGLLLTEFAPGTSPSPQNFPVRNRIISGLALGTLVVEASEYSGSLITARLAMEQNREVFALPGNITAPQSFGPNFLIKQGAKLVQSWRDIVEELPAEARQAILIREDAKSPPDPELDLLSDDESMILDMLKTDQTVQFDRLHHLSKMDIPHLSRLLLKLETAGKVRQLPGNLYVKLRKHT